MYRAEPIASAAFLEKMAGWTLLVVLLLLFLVNGAVMVLSPRRWFELPAWLASVRGRLRPEKYSNGLGAVQVRIMGALLLCLLTWILVDALSR